jgi:Tfp pilus assembly protein PilN
MASDPIERMQETTRQLAQTQQSLAETQQCAAQTQRFLARVQAIGLGLLVLALFGIGLLAWQHLEQRQDMALLTSAIQEELQRP